VPAALYILLVVLGASPLTLLFDGLLVQGLLAAALASGITIVALTVPPGEAGFLQRMFRPVAVALAIPAVWMVVQVLPLGFLRLAHPIWRSAAEALRRPLGGTISIDPGLTLLSLGRYLSAAAVMFLAAAVAIDRQRAKPLLFVLTGASALIALVAIVHELTATTFLNRLGGFYPSNAAAACAAMGVIFSAAAAAYHFGLDARSKRESFAKDLSGGVLTLTAFAVCWIALILGATGEVLLAAGCGVTTVAMLAAIRRFEIGSWSAWAMTVAVLIAMTAIVTMRFDARVSDPTMAFTGNASRALVGTAQRVMADASWTGAGAGSFSALAPIYRGADETISASLPPTTAAGIAIEMGRPMLLFVLIAAIVALIAVVRGALARGRDSFYAAAGAGCLITLLLQSFSDATLLDGTVSTIAAAAVGLALIQRKSRTAG
jgi:hypothetical protein